MLAVELEQRQLLPANKAPVEGLATVVALGVNLTVHSDAAAFAASDASLLNPDRRDNGEEPPAHYAERGLQWPPHMADESVVSYGVFGDPVNAEAHARLYGTVLHAERRTTTLTSQHFTAARVRSAGFELDMCLPATTATPQPGNIIGGDVFLVASLPVPAKAPATRTRTRWPFHH